MTGRFIKTDSIGSVFGLLLAAPAASLGPHVFEFTDPYSGPISVPRYFARPGPVPTKNPTNRAKAKAARKARRITRRHS